MQLTFLNLLYDKNNLEFTYLYLQYFATITKKFLSPAL